jgi:hypothetical protein
MAVACLPKSPATINDDPERWDRGPSRDRVLALRYARRRQQYLLDEMPFFLGRPWADNRNMLQRVEQLAIYLAEYSAHEVTIEKIEASLSTFYGNSLIDQFFCPFCTGFRFSGTKYTT